MEQLDVRPIRGEREFDAVLAIRRRVFVDEQLGPLDEEPDAWDPAATHFAAVLAGRIVGTARLYRPEPALGKIGRVAVLPEFRGQGIGARLVEAAIEHAQALGLPELILDAQTGAVGLYERFGFTPEGEEFIDAGIPHRRMRLLFPAPSTATDLPAERRP